LRTTWIHGRAGRGIARPTRTGEHAGATPAYLREQRLLAAATGFRDRRTFERAIRRQYGMAPDSWRREHHHSGSAPGSLE
jgi:hypothetical protein